MRWHWLAEHAFPDPVYQYWRAAAARGVVVVPEQAYRYFVIHGTQTLGHRIRINRARAQPPRAPSGPRSTCPLRLSCMPLPESICRISLPSYITKASNLTDWLRGLVPGHTPGGFRANTGPWDRSRPLDQEESVPEPVRSPSPARSEREAWWADCQLLVEDKWTRSMPSRLAAKSGSQAGDRRSGKDTPSSSNSTASWCRQVAKLLHRHGLGQTLAYIQLRCTGRPNSPYDLLCRATGPLAADRSGGLGPLGECWQSPAGIAVSTSRRASRPGCSSGPCAGLEESS